MKMLVVINSLISLAFLIIDISAFVFSQKIACIFMALFNLFVLMLGLAALIGGDY